MKALALLIAFGFASMLGVARWTREPPAHGMARLFAPEGISPPAAIGAGADPFDAIAAELRSAHREMPDYLRLVSEEFAPTPRESATFAVGCYWEGERDLGRMPGVMQAQTGMLDGREVVRVQFDPIVVSREELADRLRQLPCYRDALPAHAAGAIDDRTQQHFYLFLHPEYYYLPLTERQAMRIDSALALQEDPDAFLSPLQLELKRRLLNIPAGTDDAEGDLSDLTPDRSPEGLPGYLRVIEDRLDE